jgi:hypothetical protein
MIEPRENVTVLHGHLHKAIDRQHGSARVVGGAAIVDGASATLHAIGTSRVIERVA